MQFNSELARKIFEKKYYINNDKCPDDSLNRLLWVIKKYYPEIVEEVKERINNKSIGIAGGLWRAAKNENKHVSVINCTTIGKIDDSLEAISDSWYKWAKYAAFGQGEGADFSNLRPRGAKVHNSSKHSTGAVSFMITYDAILNIIAQQGRRGASLISLHISHPDIPEFISVKNKKIKLIDNEGKIIEERDFLDTANISIQMSDLFMKTLEKDGDWVFTFKNKYEKIESMKFPSSEIWNNIAKQAWKTGDPGLQFIDIIKRYSNSDYLSKDIEIESSNACFRGDTLISTKKGLRRIKNLIGKEVEVYNSKEWVKCNNFRKTNNVNKLKRIWLSSGIYFDVTAYHTFYLVNGEKKEAKNLLVGDRLEYNENIIIDGGNEVKGAYIKGFLLADGTTIKDTNRSLLYLYPPKYSCQKGLKSSLEEIKILEKNIRGSEDIYFSDQNNRKSLVGLSARDDNLNKWACDYKKELPEEVFSWSLISKLNLIKGLFDGGGCSLDSFKSFGYQFSSKNYKFIISLVRLLNSIGVYGSINYDNRNRIISSKLRNGDIKEYTFDTTYRITIGQKYSVKLSKMMDKLGGFNRLKSFSSRELRYNVKFRYNKITEIEDIATKEDVYCCTIDSTHKLLVNSGIITGNCGEVPNDKNNVCLLSSFNLAKLHLYDENYFRRGIQLLVYILDAFRRYEIDENRSPIKEQRIKLIEAPRIGIGITGLADHLIRNKIVYGEDASIIEVKRLFKIIASESYITSYNIAKEEGKSFKYYNKEKYKNSPYIQRLLSEGLIEDYHLDYQAHVTKICIAPTGSLTEIVEAGGGGIEPIFAKYYVRRERATTGEWKEWFTFNNIVRDYLEEKGLEVNKENADNLKDDYWVTSHNVNNLNKIKLISAIQRYVDSAISVTYNLKEDCSIEDVKEIYYQAWKHELKGVTVYREGSKAGVLITDSNYEKIKNKNTNKDRPSKRDLNCNHAVKRPEDVPCDIYKTRVKENTYTILVGILDGSPYEIFVDNHDLDISKYKKGITKKVKKKHYRLLSEDGEILIDNISKEFDKTLGALTRLISFPLRHNLPIQHIVDQLHKNDEFISFDKAVGRILKKYIKEGEKVTKSINCPECGSNDLIYSDGCMKCSKCYWSKCF